MNSCYYKLKNKDKSTERFPPLLSKPTYIFAHAMPRAKNGKHAKDSNCNEDERALPLYK